MNSLHIEALLDFVKGADEDMSDSDEEKGDIEAVYGPHSSGAGCLPLFRLQAAHLRPS